jgi:hypothetical protein
MTETQELSRESRAGSSSGQASLGALASAWSAETWFVWDWSSAARSTVN